MKTVNRKIAFWRVIVPATGAAILAYVILAFVFGPDAIRGSTSPAYAFHGCRYDPNSIEPISYRFFSVGSDYETAFQEAEEEWDDTTAPGYFSEQPSSLDPEINVTDDALMDQWAAVVLIECVIPVGSTFGNYRGNEVELRFNTSEMDDLSVSDKILVAIHEIGHAYGLWHVSTGCRLMRQNLNVYNSCGSTMPTADDIAGVAAIYP
ncbi:MAG: matrixin family metalloprotease [Chloroflexi bacterium]|nr:matrixin family metalloprotease [Chloroflexota bacterium]